MIEKSQEVYYQLLYAFLKQNNVYETFINELIFFRNSSSIHEYIAKEFMSVKYGDFCNAISMAFPYDETANGRNYWFGISHKWRAYLRDYKLSITTNQNTNMKSIW